MGLLQDAYETYCILENNYVGIYETGKQPLAPISHIITAADLEITLDNLGRYVTARKVDKIEGKIIIPSTEASSGRTSSPVAHPLCEQLGYLGKHNREKHELYLDQLSKWNASDYGHPKLEPILRYVKKGTILKDLSSAGLIKLDKKGAPEKEKLLVRWVVLGLDEHIPPECWKDNSLFQSFIQYYAASQGNDLDLCMVSGQWQQVADQHPKGVIAINGNAKLISANDKTGFTYLGRFTDDRQAAGLSYEVSQKAHAALRWLVANQGTIMGGRTFLCWNPHGIILPKPQSRFSRSSAPKTIPSDYREALSQTLIGEQEHLPKDASAIIAAFDAATTGRLAVTYYSRLLASDFLQRLHDWDESCCWWNRRFGIQSPHLGSIVECAYGTPRDKKMEVPEKVRGQQIQRMLACRIDSRRMPADIMQRLVNRASSPLTYSRSCWRKIVYVTCAVIQKYHAPMLKEDLCMNWSLARHDRSFQFGRLLAIMDWVEGRFNNQQGIDRTTNAIKSLEVFIRTPFSIAERINRHLTEAYLPRLDPGTKRYYERLRNEIITTLSEIADSEEALNSPLSEFYLIGYELQRNDLFRKKLAEPEAIDDEEEDKDVDLTE